MVLTKMVSVYLYVDGVGERGGGGGVLELVCEISW